MDVWTYRWTYGLRPMLGPLHKKEAEDEEEKERGMESCETLFPIAQRHCLFPPYGFSCEPQLYKRVCLSVSPSIRGSVTTSFGGQTTYAMYPALLFCPQRRMRIGKIMLRRPLILTQTQFVASSDLIHVQGGLAVSP